MLFPVGTDEFREPIWRSIEHRQEQDKTKKMRKKIWVCVLTFLGSVCVVSCDSRWTGPRRNSVILVDRRTKKETPSLFSCDISPPASSCFKSLS
jgi:hypothetical protein